MKIKLLVLSIIIIIIAFSIGIVKATNNKPKPNSREVKILLNAKKFTNKEQAFKQYWEIAKKVAKSVNVKVKEKYKGFKEKKRRVLFLDTEDFSIKKTGYVLRKRVKFKKGHYIDEAEYTVKYRSTDINKSNKAKTNAEGIYSKSEFEEDIAFDETKPDKIKRIYALRTKIKTEDKIDYNIKSFGNFFPVLLTLGIPHESIVKPVNDIIIDERKVSPGKLIFGEGIKAKPDITIWLDENGNPLIGEFSFDYKIEDFDNQQKEATKKVFEYFLKLREESKEWLAEGHTKTMFTYGKKKTN